jgi:hypothetical protein
LLPLKLARVVKVCDGASIATTTQNAKTRQKILDGQRVGILPRFPACWEQAPACKFGFGNPVPGETTGDFQQGRENGRRTAAKRSHSAAKDDSLHSADDHGVSEPGHLVR